jgi:hypothetical protein
MLCAVLIVLLIILIWQHCRQESMACYKGVGCDCPEKNPAESFGIPMVGPPGTKPCYRKTEEQLFIAMMGDDATNIGMELR